MLLSSVLIKMNLPSNALALLCLDLAVAKNSGKSCA